MLEKEDLERLQERVCVSVRGDKMTIKLPKYANIRLPLWLSW